MKEPVLTFPHAAAAIEAYLNVYNGHGQRAERLREAFDEFLRQEVNNIKIFNSIKYGVKLPYTSISVNQLAKHIYLKYHSPRGEDYSIRCSVCVKKEFVFGTGVTLTEGNEFNYIEEAMHQCVKHLPRALDELKQGRDPEDREIFTLGMPTNIFGYIHPDFMRHFSRDPFHKLAEVYAELITFELSKFLPAERQVTVELYGVSIGAGLAICTAERLIEQGAVSQNVNAAGRSPYLHIRVEAPVALGLSKIKLVQIPIGFLIDLQIELCNTYVRRVTSGKSAFLRQVQSVLSHRGILPYMSIQQQCLKGKTLLKLIVGLVDVSVPNPQTRITEIYGLRDATTFTISMARQARKRRLQFAGTLGQGMLSRQHAQRRLFTADMLHLNPRFRFNELRRMNALGISLELLAESPP